MKFYQGIFFSSVITSLNLSSNLSIQANQNNKQTSTIKNDINYRWHDTYRSWTNDSSDTYVLFDWGKYDSDWLSFNKRFPNFALEGQLYSGILDEGFYNHRLSQVFYKGSSLVFSGPDEDVYLLISAPFFKTATHYTIVNLHIWLGDNDDHKIYFKWKAFFKGDATNEIEIDIKSITFFN